jgi:hypothetical protein
MAKEPQHKVESEVWKCEDLLKALRGTIDAHVKDVAVADRLEQSLRAFYAYRATTKHLIFDEPASDK